MDARSEQLSVPATAEYVEPALHDLLPAVQLIGTAESERSFVPVLPHVPNGLGAFVPTQRGYGAADAHGGAGARLWVAARDRLALHWRQLRLIVPYLIVLALPGSFVWLPLLALWQQWQQRQRTRA